MSDDFVNQLTLNFLISKQQLQKLNKKTKDNIQQTMIEERLFYGDRIKSLFNNLFDNNPPDDLLYYVKTTFDSFIEKSIYYFKAHDNSENLEKERTEDIQDDIDYEKEERDIANGNYKENTEDDTENTEDDTETTCPNNNTIVKHKYRTKTASAGVDDIQKLPLDWFHNVRQHYKQNQIIPRKKEPQLL